MSPNIKIRLILWSALALVTGWLLYMGVVPSGRITYKIDFKNPGYFIRKLTPEERVLPPSGGEQSIVGDPAYFAVRTPRAFARAKVTVKYKAPDDIKVIEAGVLTDKRVWRYQTKPLENRNLDELSDSWSSIRQGQTLLLQKEKKFANLDDFFRNLPEPRRVAVYNFGLAAPFKLFDYQPGTSTNQFAYPIRGSYQFHTYIKDEKLSFHLAIRDLNLNRDSDPVELKLWQGSRLLQSVKLQDDGVAGDTGKAAQPRELKLEASRLPEAAYRLELAGNDDIVTDSIETPQSKLAFINKVWFAEGAKKPIVLDTDSQEVNVQTLNPSKLSTVTVGQNKLAVTETYRQYSVTTKDRLTRVVLPQDDMIVSGDGVFSLVGSFVDPGFLKVGPNFFPGQRGVEFVVADYTPPKTDKDGWRTAEAEFELGQSAYREFYKYSFMISIPGLKAEEEPQRKLVLKEIAIEFSGSSWWGKFKNIFYEK
ncbi:hypothetical protein HGA34_00690 [Candidatus Falkowbacteria bacterium]|nr:hypothetical protein [Candidatus Falkowbacteria bacterium]